MEETERRSWIRDFFFPFGSLLIGIVGLSAQRTLPLWMIALAGMYLLVVAILVLCSPTVRLLSRRRTKVNIRQLARSQFPVLLKTVKDLTKLLDSQNNNTLIYVLELAPLHDAEAGKSLPPDPQHVEALRNWALGIEERAQLKKPGDFLQISQELSLLMQQYNYFLCQRLAKLQVFIESSGLDQEKSHDIKQRWNDHRDAHNLLFGRWKDLAKRVNEAAGSRPCVDSYPSVGTLE